MRPLHQQAVRILTLVLLMATTGVGVVSSASGGDVAGTPAPLLTLEAAVQIALENNHRLGAADADLEAAEARLREARADRLPRVEVAETYSRTTNPGSVFGNLLGQESFGPEDFAIDSLNEPEPLGNFRSMVVVDQPLYTGGLIKHGIAAASLERDAAAAGRERTRQETVRQVLEAYSDAVLARHRLEAAREALETARAHVRLVSDLHEAGLVVKSDLLQARVRESEIEEMLAGAESAAHVSRAALNLVLGRDLDVPFTLQEAAEVPTRGDESLRALLEEARARRPDLKAARLRVRAAAEAVRLARAGRLPEVGVSARYEANAEDTIGADGTNWSVLVGARLELFAGRRTRPRIQRTEAEMLRAERTAQLLAQSVELEVRRAFHELHASGRRLAQALRARELARESLRIVRDRYREGLTTLPELLDAETALTRARTREVAARRDLLLTDAVLRLAVGRL